MPEIVGAFVRCHGSSLAQRLAPPQPIMLPDGMPEDISDGPVLPSNAQASAAAARRLWRRVGWRPRLGRVLASFRSIASNETLLPARISLRALLMMVRKSRFILSARDSRSTCLSETRAATGLFRSVKTRVSSAALSAAFSSGSISLGNLRDFISLFPCRQSEADWLA